MSKRAVAVVACGIGTRQAQHRLRRAAEKRALMATLRWHCGGQARPFVLLPRLPGVIAAAEFVLTNMLSAVQCNRPACREHSSNSAV